MYIHYCHCILRKLIKIVAHNKHVVAEPDTDILEGKTSVKSLVIGS